MEKILAMWAHPRSTSTAFGWMMRQRGDFILSYEPFGVSYYNSEERISQRYQHTETQPEHNYQAVWNRLKQSAQQQSIFMKDMPTHIKHFADEEFLSHFTHTFIIRHPRKALPSIFHHWPDFTLEEAGYKDLCNFFEKVSSEGMNTPVVVDSDDLLQRPAKVVQAYCTAVDIPFMPEALTWEPGPRSEVSLINGGTWHEHLRKTQGFKERKDKSDFVAIESNEHLMKAYEACMPYYEKLYQHRLCPSPSQVFQ